MAYLKKSDLQYEDLAYKKYWSEQYGYDYDKNADIQSKIHRMVLAEVDMGLESFQGKERSYAPLVGKITFNGVEFIVSADDRDAYSARFPQATSKGRKREDALRRLKEGGTMSPDGGEAKDKSSKDSEGPTETPVAPATPPPPDNTVDAPERTPILPLPPTTATHKVKTSGSRLAFRKAPAQVKVSEIATEDTEKKGELIEMLDNGTTFIVLEPGVGHRCEWDFIKYGSTEGYVYNKFTEHMSGKFLEYDCSAPYNSPFKISPDWTMKEPNKPYKDETIGKWCISYETPYGSAGGTELKSRMLESRSPAIKILMKEIGKKDGDTYVDDIVESIGAVRVEDYYVSDRPGENMRVLITLPIKYVSKLEGKTQTKENEDDSGNASSGGVYSEDSNLRAGATRQTVLYLHPSASYKNRVKKVAEGMRAYAKQIDNFEGEVRNLDFRKEADRFERFIESFNSLLSSNGSPREGEHSIEFGMDQDFIPVYAAENSSGFYKVMTRAWESFKDSEPADAQRSTRYLFYLWDMQEAIEKNMGWIEFVGRFTDYEQVEIFPSSSSGNSVGDISGMGNESNPSSSGQTTADKVDKKISKTDEDEAPDSCFENVSIKGLMKGKIKPGKSLKGAADKLKENLIFGSADIRKSVGAEAKAAVDFVGAPLLSDIGGQLSKVNELDDVFDVVLNKISLMDLAGAILACFNVDFKLDLKIDLPDIDLRLDCLELPKIPTIKLPDNLPTMDIMADLPKEIFNAIVDALTQAFVQMIKDLVESLLDLCKEEAEDTAANINDGIEEATENAAMNADEAAALANQKKKEVLAAAGLLGGPLQAPLTDAEKADRLSDLSNLLSDISLLVPPSELCRLLHGKSSPRTLSIVRSLVNRKYPNFKSKLRTKTSIRDFMVLIGRLVESRFCEQLANAPQTKYGVDNFCTTDADDLGTPRAQRIRSKGDITEDQILEQLERAQARKKKRADDLSNIIKGLAAMQSGDENPFQDAMPPLFCGKNPDGSPKPGLIELKHDSIDFMLEKVMDTVYEPVLMAFNRDISSYQDVMITNTNETREINVVKEVINEDGDPKAVWHPEVLRQEAQGVTFDFKFEDGDQSKPLQPELPNDNKIEVQGGSRKVNTTTRDLLNNLEQEGAFVAKYDTESVYYEMVLPPDPNTRTAIEQLREQLSMFENMEGFNYSDIDFDKLMEATPDWKIRYKLPYQTTDKNVGQLVDDEYIIEIFPGDDPDATDLTLRRHLEPDVHPDAKDYIQGLYGSKSVIGDVFEENEDNPLTVDYVIEHFVTTCTETTTKICDESGVQYVDIEECYTVSEQVNTSDASALDAFLETQTPEEVCKILLSLLGNDVLRDERIYNRFKENWGCISGLLLETQVKHMPPQAEVFGRQVERMWSNAITETPSIEYDEELLSRVRKYYATYSHPRIVHDVIAMLGKRIADSVLFKSHNIVIPGADSPSSTPYLEKVNFLREPTKIEKACDIDPHPLTLEEYKKSAKDDYSNGGGFCSLIDDVADDSKQDPLRAAMLKSVVEMTVRAYVIDFFLRGVFVFTQFEEALDDYVLEFLVKKLVEEIRSYQGGYPEAFFDYVSSMKPKEKDAGAEEDQEAKLYAKKTSEVPDIDEHLISVLKDVFIDEFAQVAVELKDLIQRSDPELEQNISFDNTINIHDLLIGNGDEESWIPVIDLAKSESDARFTNAWKSQVDNGLDFDLVNGNMFLEKFFKVTKKQLDYQAIAVSLKPIVTGNALENYISAQNTAQQDAASEPGGVSAPALQASNFEDAYNELAVEGIREALESAWSNTFGSIGLDGDSEVYVGVHEIDSLIDQFVASIYNSIESSKLSITATGTLVRTDGDSGASFFGNASNLFSEVADSIWTFGNFFESISTGMRLCFVSPDGDSSDITEAAVGGSTINKLSKKYRSYRVTEGADVYYASPLIEVLDYEIYDDVRGQSLLSLSEVALSGSSQNPWSQTYYSEAHQSKLKGMITQSPEYAAIFKYSIPAERFLGLLAVYTIMSVSSAPRVESIFEGTKDELMRAFMVLSNSSWKAPEGPSNSDIASFHEHFGGITTPCFSFSWGLGGMPGFKGFGMDIVLKLAIKTPLLIFKAVVEMIDPNIKIAKWIIDLAKFVGICLPMPAISLGLLPPTVFGFPPFGIGIGPPLTPLGFGYLALGFEIPIGNPFANSSSDGDTSGVSEEQCMEEIEKKKERVAKLKEKILATRQK